MDRMLRGAIYPLGTGSGRGRGVECVSDGGAAITRSHAMKSGTYVKTTDWLVAGVGLAEHLMVRCPATLSLSPKVCR